MQKAKIDLLHNL
uniref:Uncharacterized protein n=1 Tax=Rhizophora mucronata TaxID=61149 RepID=A0A2P2N9Z8_RHIMU